MKIVCKTPEYFRCQIILVFMDTHTAQNIRLVFASVRVLWHVLFRPAGCGRTRNIDGDLNAAAPVAPFGKYGPHVIVICIRMPGGRVRFAVAFCVGVSDLWRRVRAGDRALLKCKMFGVGRQCWWTRVHARAWESENAPLCVFVFALCCSELSVCLLGMQIPAAQRPRWRCQCTRLTHEPKHKRPFSIRFSDGVQINCNCNQTCHIKLWNFQHIDCI